MQQHLSFYLNTAFLTDEETGEVTGFFVQFPNATVQAPTIEQAEKLLGEILPHMMKENFDEFRKYHSGKEEALTFKQIRVTA